MAPGPKAVKEVLSLHARLSQIRSGPDKSFEMFWRETGSGAPAEPASGADPAIAMIDTVRRRGRRSEEWSPGSRRRATPQPGRAAGADTPPAPPGAGRRPGRARFLHRKDGLPVITTAAGLVAGEYGCGILRDGRAWGRVVTGRSSVLSAERVRADPPVPRARVIGVVRHAHHVARRSPVRWTVSVEPSV